MIRLQILRLWAAAATIIASSAAAPMANVPLPPLATIQADTPDLLVPGTSHLLLDTDPSGYVVCTAVIRYFDDETASDLEVELDLAARQQLVRFLTVPAFVDGQEGRGHVTVHGFHQHAVWWEGEALHGLYFLPVEGVDRAARQNNAKNEDAPKAPTASALLLEGRVLRKQGDWPAARKAFEKVRVDYPLSAEARRALHEIYLANTAEKEQRIQNKGSRP